MLPFGGHLLGFTEALGAPGPAAHLDLLLGQSGMFPQHSESTTSSPRVGPIGPVGSCPTGLVRMNIGDLQAHRLLAGEDCGTHLSEEL